MKPLDAGKLLALARLGASQAQMARVMKCSQSTISRRFALARALALAEIEAEGRPR